MLVITACSAPAGEDGANQDPVRLIDEAYLAARDNLRSGIGTGILEIHRQEPGSEQWELIVKARAKIHFSGRKYHIRLEHEKDKVFNQEANVIIYDGTALVVNRISKLIRPKGAEAEILPVEEKDTSPTRAGFPFDPTKLPQVLLNVNTLVRKYNSSMKLTSREGGGYAGRCRTPILSIQFTALPEFGYNVGSVQLFLLEHNFLHQELKATWNRSDNVWYVKSLFKQVNIVNGEKTRISFAYESFKPNADVPPEMFRFGALELPQDSRILDQRPEAEIRSYRNTPAKNSEDRQIEDLLEHVETLPDAEGGQVGSISSRSLQVVLTVMGVMLSILGILLLWWRTFKQRRVPQKANGTKSGDES
jgi:hypothetical protein